ncbi:hypothetical protein [Pannonibacter sp.]|uniref:hypothetical protein n=1 Tax=Pannonibacter sp. TaxID=1906786 RepID=UPI00394CD7EF
MPDLGSAAAVTPIADRINEILAAPGLAREERIKGLTLLRDDARAEQRAASESGMIDDDGLTDVLTRLDLAISRLGGEALADEEGRSPASL